MCPRPACPGCGTCGSRSSPGSAVARPACGPSCGCSSRGCEGICWRWPAHHRHQAQVLPLPRPVNMLCNAIRIDKCWGTRVESGGSHVRVSGDADAKGARVYVDGAFELAAAARRLRCNRVSSAAARQSKRKVAFSSSSKSMVGSDVHVTGPQRNPIGRLW